MTQGVALAETGLPEVAAAIVDRIAGGEYVDDICETEGMPSPRTVRRWQQQFEDFGRQCAHARAYSAVLVERKVAQVVERVLAGEISPEQGRAAMNGLTWIAKVREPKVYGDKVELEHKGQIAIVPVLNVTVSGPAPEVIDLTPVGG